MMAPSSARILVTYPSTSTNRRAPRPGRAVARVALLGVLLPLAPATWSANLLDLYELASRNDPVLKQAIANFQAVSENRPQAFAQLYLPTFSLTANAFQNYQDIDVGQGFGAGGNVDFGTRSLQVQATMPLLHYERLVALKQADSQIREAELLVAAERNDLIIRLSERFFDVLAAEDTLTFARAEKLALARQLEQAQQRFDVGLVAITDVQEAQAGYDLAVADEIQAQNDLEDAMEALREVTGQYPDSVATLAQETVPLAAPEPDDIDHWTSLAIDQNYRLQAALASAENAQKNIRLQYADRFPTVDAIGRHAFDSQGGRFGAVSVSGSTIGVQMEWAPFQSGQISSRTRQAEFRHTESLEVVEEQRRSVTRQTRDSFLGVLSGISRVKALEQAVRSTQTALEATQSGFEVGTRTSVDVVTAEREVSGAKRDLSRARYDYLLDVLRLKSAASSLVLEDVAEINGWLN